MMAERKHKLTARQKAFCREYLISNNASAAARKAGFSAKYADRLAYQLLELPWVQQEIARLRARAEDEAICTVKEADAILSQMLRAKVSDFEELLPDGERVTAYDSSKPNQHGVKALHRKMYSTGSGDGKMDVTVAGVELHDKSRCLDIFYKRFNAYPRQESHVEVDGLKEFLEFIGKVDGKSMGPPMMRKKS